MVIGKYKDLYNKSYPFYTVKEMAEIIGMHRDAVRRKFQDMKILKPLHPERPKCRTMVVFITDMQNKCPDLAQALLEAISLNRHMQTDADLMTPVE
jgi:hypothetical protein